MTTAERHDRDINDLILNVRSIDSIYGSWAKEVSASHNVGDGDHYAVFLVTTGASAIVSTLPAASALNIGRSVTFTKVDAGAGTDRVTDGTLSLYLINQGDTLTVRSDGSAWYVRSGVVQPVPDEPSLGTPHFTTSTAAVHDISRTAETWAAPYVWDLSGLIPIGATAVYIFGQAAQSTTAAVSGFSAAFWNFNYGAFNTIEARRRGLYLDVAYKPATGAAEYALSDMTKWVKIGASRKLYVGLNATEAGRFVAGDFCGYLT